VQIGALVQRDFLTPEIGNRIQLAVLRHQDRLALRRRRLIGDIADRAPAALSEDRGASPVLPKSIAPTLKRFEQRRAGRKLRPHHFEAGGLQLSSSVPLLLSSTSLPYFWKPMRTTLSCP